MCVCDPIITLHSTGVCVCVCVCVCVFVFASQAPISDYQAWGLTEYMERRYVIRVQKRVTVFRHSYKKKRRRN